MQAIEIYLHQGLDTSYGAPHVLYVSPDSKRDYCVEKIELLDEDAKPKPFARPLEYACFRLRCRFPERIVRGTLLLEITTDQGVLLCKLETNPDDVCPFDKNSGVVSIDCEIPKLPLTEGRYLLRVGLAIHNVRLLCYQDNAGYFNVSASAPEKYELLRDLRGPLAIEHKWLIKREK